MQYIHYLLTCNACVCVCNKDNCLVCGSVGCVERVVCIIVNAIIGFVRGLVLVRFCALVFVFLYFFFFVFNLGSAVDKSLCAGFVVFVFRVECAVFLVVDGSRD